jgi:chromosomal replication initiator protein
VNAVISGQAGVAVLVDGARLATLHVGSAEPRDRRSEEVRLLVGDAADLEFAEDVELQEVTRRLDLASDRCDALHLALLLLDGTLTADTRRTAAGELDELLPAHGAAEYVEGVLFARPLPHEADLAGAHAASSHRTRYVTALLRRLESLQPAITEVWQAWEAIPPDVFETDRSRASAQKVCVVRGLFRDLVERRAAGESTGAFRLSCLLDPSFQALRNHRAILEQWLSGLPQEMPGPELRTEVAEAPAAPAESQAPAPQFDPKHTFASFVVGSSNQFAHAAARAVAENPSQSYNPLFLYGDVGLGKTHLLHAVACQIHEQRPALKILYLVAEQFVNELINSIRFDRMPAFRERYRTIDVLLVDDVQFIANKERTQEAFLHAFDTLYASQKQIIISSDSSPRHIPAFEERLRNRFEGGLVADIQPPDLETKVAILRRKAEAEAIDLPNDVAHFIARQARSNVRELEGLLNRVIAFSSLTGKPPSLDLAKETLGAILADGAGKPAAAEIIKFVAQHYGLRVSEIKSEGTVKQIVHPRQVAMYMLKRLTDLSYPEIGKQFNDKHRSTVMYAVGKVQRDRVSDPEFAKVLAAIEQHFRL